MKEYPPRVYLRPFGVTTDWKNPQGSYYLIKQRSPYTEPEYISLEEHQALLAVAVECINGIEHNLERNLECDCCVSNDAYIRHEIKEALAKLRGEK